MREGAVTIRVEEDFATNKTRVLALVDSSALSTALFADVLKVVKDEVVEIMLESWITREGENLLNSIDPEMIHDELKRAIVKRMLS